MPNGTPTIKIANVQRLGAKVVLHGFDFDEAKAECARLAVAHGLTFVPPYDDPLVIAGQGTIAMEILKQLPDSDTLGGIFGAIGGGGLVAGIAEYVKRIGSPQTKIYGAETVDADAMYQSLKQGHRVTLAEVGPFSDGTAVRLVGAEPFRICQRLLDEIVRVDNDELCAAIKDIFEGTFHNHFARLDDHLCVAETRSITEPAGALALAGLKHHIITNKLIGAQQKFVAVVSGANMNFDRLRFVAERAELGEGREALLSVEIPETPGRYILTVTLSSLPQTLNIVSLHSTLSYTLDPSRNSPTVTIHRILHTSSSHSDWSPRRGQKRCQQCWMLFNKRDSMDLTLATTRWRKVTQGIWWGDVGSYLTNVYLDLVGLKSSLYSSAQT